VARSRQQLGEARIVAQRIEGVTWMARITGSRSAILCP
jgi:hypothetical protein